MPSTTASTPEHQPVDFRQYIGIIFFRWQTIVVCFLWCLLLGVLYLELAPKRYRTECKITLYRDPVLSLTTERTPVWTSFSLHEYMLTNDRLIERVVDLLSDEWASRFSNPARMALDVHVERNRGIDRLITVYVLSGNPEYGREFLSTLVREHEAEWQNLQRQARESAGKLLEQELVRLDHSIKDAEEDLLEYQRLHDIARVEARSTMESRYLEALMERKNQISTELMMLEAQYPLLKEAGVGVISDVARMTRETGSVSAPVEAASDEASDVEVAAGADKPKLPDSLQDRALPAAAEDDGYRTMSIQLRRLQAREREMAASMTAENPQLQAVREEIRKAREQLELAAQSELQQLQDRHRALTLQLNAIEAAEYKWQAKNLLASQRKAEFNRIAGIRDRFVKNYGMLYERLHDMRVSEELKAEQFNVSEEPTTNQRPVWPDPAKILLVALAAGLGSGFGLALLLQVLDNKVQSIRHVEEELGVTFLGGIPYWVHGGLETTIRPIVTEEHSAGAVEAYRALRTNVLAAMEKVNEKVLLVTSADSREGKTLTTLNMAIMIAQMGKRVLLVDMDLHRGRLHRSLGVERSPGVTDALQKKQSLREVVSGTRIQNLDLAPTGSTIDDAAELLQSTGMVNVFADIQDDYDYIVVDTSPVLRVTDTVILTTQGVGVVLFVARVNHTPRHLIKYSLNMLQEARVLGLVLNSIEMHKISSLYYAYQYPNYAYYSNAYAYGYNYYYYGDEGGSGRRRRRGVRGRIRRAGDWVRRTLMPTE